MCVLVLFVAMIKLSDQMQLRVRQVYVTVQVAGSYRGKSKQEFGAGTMQEELGSWHRLMLSWLFHAVQDYLLREWCHPQLAGPSSINGQ